MADPGTPEGWPPANIPSYLVSGGDLDGLLVIGTALRHGVTEPAIRHAVGHHWLVEAVDEELTMVVGPGITGELFEVGIVPWHGELAVVHAMPARAKYLPGRRG